MAHPLHLYHVSQIFNFSLSRRQPLAEFCPITEDLSPVLPRSPSTSPSGTVPPDVALSFSGPDQSLQFGMFIPRFINYPNVDVLVGLELDPRSTPPLNILVPSLSPDTNTNILSMELTAAVPGELLLAEDGSPEGSPLKNKSHPVVDKSHETHRVMDSTSSD